MITVFLTLYAGFTHAFETDHLLAVSNMVTTRSRLNKAMKDGIFWGLGHTSTILIVGCIFLIIKFQIATIWFSYFEATVGLMLVSLGLYRLLKWYKKKPTVSSHYHDGHIHNYAGEQQSHLPAYLIGLVHGLAGSGALMLVVLSKTQSTESSLLYLALFGAGSVAGMMLAAALFSLPFSKKYLQHNSVQALLILVSSALCIAYGFFIVKENLYN
jgi:cytochrome c biogenesis protein CcdA